MDFHNIIQATIPRHLCLSLCAISALAGCDNSQTEEAPPLDPGSPEAIAQLEAETTLSSGFTQPSVNGTFATALTPAFTGSFKDSAGNGYAYEVSRTGTAFGATAGLLQDTQVGALPTQGMAAMSGVWNIAEIGKSNGTGREFGEAVQYSGRITLSADFEFGTLEGTSEDLIVLGTFDGSDLGGDVFFDRRAAKLTGLVGEDRAIGAFHGTDGNTAFSGGFYVEP